MPRRQNKALHWLLNRGWAVGIAYEDYYKVSATKVDVTHSGEGQSLGEAMYSLLRKVISDADMGPEE